MDPLVGAAAISGLANLGGGFMSAQGASAANAANLAQANMINQQMLNAQMAQHEQNTAFMEDAQAHQIFSQNMAQEFNASQAGINRDWSSDQAQRQMGFQREMVAQQLGFQERMANTAYQRAMADMKKAGLNPILAYQQGGASAPIGGSAAGAMGSSSAASSSGGSAGMASAAGPPSLRAANILNDKEQVGRAIGNAVSSAVDVAKTIEGVDLMKQQNKESQQREVVGAADARLRHWDAEKREREVQNTEIQGQILKSQSQSAAAHARADAVYARDAEKYGSSRGTPAAWERMFRMLGDKSDELGRIRIPVPEGWPTTP